MTTHRDNFDSVIGRLDRILSEFLLLSNLALDQADLQTIKHHAGDLIGVGKKALANIGPPESQTESAERVDNEKLSAERMEFLVNNPPWS